ncbi:MAG: copper resistance protein CopC [Marmoricola sp.]
MVRRFALAAALALVGAVLLAGPASAHASLLGTDPTEGQVLATAPATATFTFDEQVRSESGGVHVFAADGKELHVSSHTADDRLVVDLPKDSMAQGTFVVAWRVISSDGHPVGGALTFSVGAPSATIAPHAGVADAAPAAVRGALGVVQALVYLGVFGACGLVVFLLLLLPDETGLDQVRRRLLGLADGFGWVVLGAGFALLPLTSLYQRAVGFTHLFSSTTWSDSLHGAQALSSLLLLLGTEVAIFGARAGGVRNRRTALGAIGLTLLTFSLVGHTRSVDPTWLMVLADLTHVLAGTIWFGGLVGLVISMRRLADRPRTAALALGRFSVVAAWVLLTLTVAGSVLAWRILKTWSNLFHTDFGIVLLVKVGFVGVVALIAAYNRYRLLPVVLADSGFADRAAASSRMQRSVRLEALLLVVVLGLTGFLVDRSPVQSAGAVAVPGALDSSTYVGASPHVKVVAHVDPATVGRSTIVLQLQDTAGDPIEPAALPTVSASLGDIALGDQAVSDVDSGTYQVSTLFPAPGTWTLQVSVVLSEFDNPVVTIRVPVTAAR